MSTENISIAVLDERLKNLMSVLEDLKRNQDKQGHWQVTMEKDLIHIKNGLQDVQNNFAKSAPTIEEFITIKHKVVGAGILGKWMWALLGGVIGIIFSMRADLVALITWFRGG